MSSLNLKGRQTKNWEFFQSGFGCLVRNSLWESVEWLVRRSAVMLENGSGSRWWIYRFRTEDHERHKSLYLNPSAVHRRWGMVCKISKPMIMSFPLRADLKTLCWIVNVGNNWIKMGLLIFSIVKWVPLATRNCWEHSYQWEWGRSFGFMIEAAEPVSKKAMAISGFKNLERRREIGATGTGWEVKMGRSKA